MNYKERTLSFKLVVMNGQVVVIKRASSTVCQNHIKVILSFEGIDLAGSTVAAEEMLECMCVWSMLQTLQPGHSVRV